MGILEICISTYEDQIGQQVEEFLKQVLVCNSCAPADV